MCVWLEIDLEPWIQWLVNWMVYWCGDHERCVCIRNKHCHKTCAWGRSQTGIVTVLSAGSKATIFLNAMAQVQYTLMCSHARLGHHLLIYINSAKQSTTVSFYYLPEEWVQLYRGLTEYEWCCFSLAVLCPLHLKKMQNNNTTNTPNLFMDTTAANLSEYTKVDDSMLFSPLKLPK